ncbi:homer protein-like protein 1 [Platysternon megacephalum]|uniref:Homer protein-like protein 1 n=1 Tax=Platysternon megacephalum TaxID=55544 RepID=A0A4D9EWI0_9SAUR|nr:homer protein-like protein 1 [Platysternon megacephalum]
MHHITCIGIAHHQAICSLSPALEWEDSARDAADGRQIHGSLTGSLTGKVVHRYCHGTVEAKQADSIQPSAPLRLLLGAATQPSSTFTNPDAAACSLVASYLCHLAHLSCIAVASLLLPSS